MNLTSDEIIQLKQAFNLYHLAEWEELRRRVEAGSFGDPKTSLVARLMTKSLEDVDEHGKGTELALCLHGFYLYYQAKYEESFDSFWSAHQRQSGWGSWSALGLGKVYSDLGKWEQARLWLCESLRLARQDADFDRMAECYGALGEVLLRTQHPTEAYELFSTDAALLPPGSGERLRLKNYQALCLGRLRKSELAEPMLFEGYYSAQNGAQNAASATFSLASLMTLSVLHRNRVLYERVKDIQANNSHSDTVESITQMPRGIMAVCDAAWCWFDRDALPLGSQQRAALDDKGLMALHDASQCFEAKYPIEHRWGVSLIERWQEGQQSVDSHAAWSKLSQRGDRPPSPSPVSPPSIIDRWVFDVDLSGGDLIQELSSGDVSEAWNKLRLFMI